MELEKDAPEGTDKTFKVCNEYLKALISGDQAAIEVAGKAWEELAKIK